MVKPPLRTKSIGFKVSEEEYARLETAAQARRVAQAFDLGGITNTVGAPFFAHSAKGGSRECPARRGLITLPVLETRFSSGPHSLAPARLRRAGRTDNCSSAIAPANSPNPASRDCGACTSVFPPASLSSTR
jgi:hypothetical protein